MRYHTMLSNVRSNICEANLFASCVCAERRNEYDLAEAKHFAEQNATVCGVNERELHRCVTLANGCAKHKTQHTLPLGRAFAKRSITKVKKRIRNREKIRTRK